MSPSASIHPGDAVYAKHWQSAFAAPLCHISCVDIWICHCVSGLQNVFIIGLYYKQRRLVLKNEVKKTTTRPRRPSGPKWTTHTVSAKRVHKTHIRIQESRKQAHRPTLKPLSVPPVRDPLFVNSADVAMVWPKAPYFFSSARMYSCESRTETNTNFVVWIFSSWISKCVLWTLSVFVRESGGREEMGIERFQFHINIYRDIFENILELINKVIVALRCFQFRRNSFLFFFFSFFFFDLIISGSDKLPQC